MDLPSISERFEADTAPWVAAMETAIASIRELREEVEAIAATVMVANEEFGSMARAAAVAAGADTAMARAAADAARAAAGSAASARAAAREAEALAIASGVAGGALDDEAAAAGRAAIALEGQALAARAAADSGAELGRTAAYLNETFGLIVQSSDQVLASSQRLSSLNDSMAAGYDLIQSRAVAAALTQRQLAAVNDSVAASFGRAEALEAEMAADAARVQDVLTAARLASMDATLSLARADAVLTEAALTSAGASKAAADAAGQAAGSARVWIGGLRVTGAAIHWLISGTAELLAVTIPAAIAAGAGAFALYQGAVEQVSYRMEALYTTTEATASMIGKTTGDVLGLGHAFQAAQDAANPVAYELLGSYLSAARLQMGSLASAGLEVARVLGTFAAKIDVDLRTQSTAINSLLSSMVSDLTGIGQFFGNLGHALLNFAAAMPGLAELLLKIADAVSSVILWVSRLPPHLITVAMVMEETYRWGGLLVSVLARIPAALTALIASGFGVIPFLTALAEYIRVLLILLPAMTAMLMGTATRLLAEVAPALAQGTNAVAQFASRLTGAIDGLTSFQLLGIGAVVAGLGLMIWALDRSHTATEQWITGLQQAVSKASNIQALGVLMDNMAQLSQRTAQASAAADRWSSALGHTQASLHAGGAVLDQATHQVSELHGAMASMSAQAVNVIQGGEMLGRTYGTTLAQSLALADVAGVKLTRGILGQGEAAQVARQQIANLVAGYRGADQVGGILGSDMNMLAIQSGLADTKVSQLDQAFQQFIGNATGLTNGIATLNQEVAELGDTGRETGHAFTAFHGQAQLALDKTAKAMQSFSGAGAQVWQNFDAALNQAAQYVTQLDTAAAYGAVGQKSYSQQIAFVTGELLPYARYSRTATAELSILAQKAGGHATESFRQLSEWVRRNTESAKDFQKQTQAETFQLSDAAKAASEFASTLNSDVAASLDSAKIGAAHLTTAAATLDQQWNQTHTVTSTLTQDFQNLVTRLYDVYGNTKTAQGVADAYARSLGLTKTQVRDLDEAVSGLITRLDSLHSRSITITTHWRTVGSGSGPGGTPGPSGANPRVHSAADWLVTPGTGHGGGAAGGGDTHLYMTAGIAGPSASPGVLVVHQNIETPVHLDGEEVWRGQQRKTMTYGLLNSGDPRTGTWTPRQG